MKLLLDIGNTRLKWGWWENGLRPGGVLVHAGRAPQAVLDAIDLKLTPRELWVASVAADGLRAAVEDWAQRHCQLAPRWVRSSTTACGVRNAYADPEKLGVDRWLAMIAAFHRARGAVVVVDAGTALTLDLVDARGQHRGGLIAPGLATQRHSLRQGTQVRAGEPEQTPGWLGTDTDTAVAWGTLHAALGLIERVSGAIEREHADIKLVITGGDAPMLHPLLGTPWVLAPDLVLEGLGRLAESPARAPSA